MHRQKPLYLTNRILGYLCRVKFEENAMAKDKTQKTTTPAPAARPGATPAPATKPVATPAAAKPAAQAQPSRLELLEAKQDVLEQRIADLEKTIASGVKGTAGPKPKFGRTRAASPTKDSKTGALYESKSACAKAVAAEFNLDPDDHFAWYQIIKLAPDRFVPCNEQETAIVAKMREERIAKEQAELDAKLAAEEAGKGQS